MEDLNIDNIRRICNLGNLLWTDHVAKRFRQRGIRTSDIENAIKTGEIIEEYPNDYPYPSCLILGLSVKNQLIHLVCGVGEDFLYIITTYFPDPNKWEEGFKIRKGD